VGVFKYFAGALATITAVLMNSSINQPVSGSDAQSDRPPNALTQPVTLFALKYGEADTQVGVVKGEGGYFGPSALVVADDGAIYIGDDQNDCVKRFDRRGNLLMKTEPTRRIAMMGVDTSGRIYVLGGAGLNVIRIYDSSGRRLRKREGDIVRHLLRIQFPEDRSDWEQTLELNLSQGRELDMLWDMLHGEFRVTPWGDVYLLPEHEECEKCRPYIVRIPSGQVTPQIVSLPKELLKIRLYDRARRLYHCARVSTPRTRRVGREWYDVSGKRTESSYEVTVGERLVVTVYSAQGSPVRRISLPPSEPSDFECSMAWVDMAGIDNRGHIYRVEAPLRVFRVSRKPDDPSFHVRLGYTIVEYDAAGNFVGVRAVFSYPPLGGEVAWYAVDGAGNVYWVEYYAEHLEVMMAPVPQSAR
jgi:hypothetical protein